VKQYVRVMKNGGDSGKGEFYGGPSRYHSVGEFVRLNNSATSSTNWSVIPCWMSFDLLMFTTVSQ
jgi:hypothetical protein